MEYTCNLCPRRCNALRTETENQGGFCKMPFTITAALASKHYWEEPCISGQNGSGAIFFSGCQLRCVYCQNHKLSHLNFGKAITPLRLAEIFKELVSAGAHNINLVSATQFVPLIIEAFKIYKPTIPIVYNSGGYELCETLEILRPYVDIFLFDIKYFDNEKAFRYSAAKDYPEIVKNAVLKGIDIVGKPKYNSNGIMQKGIIVRHLLLPSCTNDAISIMRWVKDNNLQVVFSLMNQYTVMPNVPKELNRKVTKREYDKVQEAMLSLNLDGYVQDCDSADIKYIPNFNLFGL